MDEMLKNTQMWLNYTYSGKSGYAEVPEDGGEASNSRYLTFRGLTRALQIELGGLTVDGDFGDGTAARFDAVYPNGYGQTSGEHNMSYIIQGACWTKGQYNPGGFDGQFGPDTEDAIKEFQADAGISQTGKVDGYILQGLMNTDDYSYSGSSTSDEGYKHQVQMMLNERYYTQIGLTAPNGLWERKSHRNLIKACQIEWSITVDGIFGNDAYNTAPTLSINTSGWTNSKRLLQAALAVNGFWPGGLTGTFGSGTQSAVTQFQSFVCLGADGIAGKNTWASLLKSSGYSGRIATACDTATQLTLAQAQALKAAGYDTVGRYLTKVPGGLDKNLTVDEIENLSTAGMKVFPIYQTNGNDAKYFSRAQGMVAAIEAKKAARRLGFPSSTVIYFAVDYDVLTAEINSKIIPHFKGIKDYMDGAFKIGAYAPRAVCVALSEAGLTEKSFVADMSSGFTGNIGVKMPDDWAYDQFAEITQSGIGIDKCIASPRATAILASQLSPEPEEPEYCGGNDYRNVSHHHLVLGANGVYTCTDCGYEVLSPLEQDADILSFNDQLTIKALLHAYVYLSGVRNDAPDTFPPEPFDGNPNGADCHYYYPERCLMNIDRIRSEGSENSEVKYEYCDSNGNYYPEYANYYTMLDTDNGNNLLFPATFQIDILNIGYYSGLFEGLFKFGVGLFVPTQYSTFYNAASLVEAIGKNDTTSILSALAGLLNLDDISNALGILGVFEGTDATMELGDYYAEIRVASMMNELTLNVHFDNNQKLKQISWNWFG